jgi:hypothetical protein
VDVTGGISAPLRQKLLSKFNGERCSPGALPRQTPMVLIQADDAGLPHCGNIQSMPYQCHPRRRTLGDATSVLLKRQSYVGRKAGYDFDVAI